MLLCENERVEENINTWKLSKFSFCHGTTLNFKLYETRLLGVFFTGPLNLLFITGARIIVFGL